MKKCNNYVEVWQYRYHFILGEWKPSLRRNCKNSINWHLPIYFCIFASGNRHTTLRLLFLITVVFTQDPPHKKGPTARTGHANVFLMPTAYNKFGVHIQFFSCMCLQESPLQYTKVFFTVLQKLNLQLHFIAAEVFCPLYSRPFLVFAMPTNP